MASMLLVLEVTGGPFQGKLIVVKRGETIKVGRTPKAQIALGDTYLSGVHFELGCTADGAHVRDLKSRNGTKLNGEYVEEAALNPGDKVFAGQTEFVVRFEMKADLDDAQILSRSLGGSKRKSKKSSKQIASKPEEPTYEMPDPPPPTPKLPQPTLVPDEIRSKPKVAPTPTSGAPVQTPSEILLSAFESATPEGRLFQILSNQSDRLMALIDGIRDRKAIEFLKTPGLDYSSLYTSDANSMIAPYLVSLPPRSDVLKLMIKNGWGKEWGVFLTCTFSLSELRDYLRSTLMVTMPDGMELFSRYYDPRFFRDFFEGCSGSEAEKFFGPIRSYFVEDERPEILLQYTLSAAGTAKQGHLLTELA